MTSAAIPNQTSNARHGELTKRESSLFLTTCFAGMGAGFMTFWLTLSLLYSGALCAFGAPLIWIFVKDARGTNLAYTSLMIYLISALVGIVVGFATSFGTGMPVSI